MKFAYCLIFLLLPLSVYTKELETLEDAGSDDEEYDSEDEEVEDTNGDVYFCKKVK